MKKNTNYRAWGSVGHYLQGPGLLNEIEKYVSLFGHKHVYLIDNFFYEEWNQKLAAMYETSESEFCSYVYEGEVSHSNIDIFRKQTIDDEVEVVVAIGGGKTIDVAKMIAADRDCALVVCPTIASTDAPTSAMSILYSDEGKMNEVVLHKKNPELVLVDSKIIINAPVRFLVAGMGDALSTYFEGVSNTQTAHENYVWCDKKTFLSTISGQAVARACYDTLLRDGMQAKIACEKHLLTPALENVIEANILMSGLGFENVGCSIAHAIGNAITVLPEGERKMHGERVGFGVICQLIAEEYAPEIMDKVLKFCVGVGIPVCFQNLEIEMTDEKLRKIAVESLEADSWDACRKTYDVDSIIDLMLMADAIGCEYLSK